MTWVKMLETLYECMHDGSHLPILPEDDEAEEGEFMRSGRSIGS